MLDLKPTPTADFKSRLTTYLFNNYYSYIIFIDWCLNFGTVTSNLVGAIINDILFFIYNVLDSLSCMLLLQLIVGLL